jgi:hypothetical protein
MEIWFGICFSSACSVITCIFAKWFLWFVGRWIWIYFSLEDIFSSGWNKEPGQVALDDLRRFLTKPSCRIILTNTAGNPYA